MCGCACLYRSIAPTVDATLTTTIICKTQIISLILKYLSCNSFCRGFVSLCHSNCHLNLTLLDSNRNKQSDIFRKIAFALASFLHVFLSHMCQKNGFVQIIIFPLFFFSFSRLNDVYVRLPFYVSVVRWIVCQCSFACTFILALCFMPFIFCQFSFFSLAGCGRTRFSYVSHSFRVCYSIFQQTMSAFVTKHLIYFVDFVFINRR